MLSLSGHDVEVRFLDGVVRRRGIHVLDAVESNRRLWLALDPGLKIVGGSKPAQELVNRRHVESPALGGPGGGSPALRGNRAYRNKLNRNSSFPLCFGTSFSRNR